MGVGGKGRFPSVSDGLSSSQLCDLEALVPCEPPSASPQNGSHGSCLVGLCG